MKPEFFQGALDMEQPYTSKHKQLVSQYFKSLSVILGVGVLSSSQTRALASFSFLFKREE